MHKEVTEGLTGGDLPTILALDSSSKMTSLAIVCGDRLIASFGAALDDNRSARLWELTDFLLTAVGLKIADVDCFAVCIGPGGFTGLRVGMATVQGFAGALKKTVIGVTSLEALAATDCPATRICVLSNAYKGELYWQLFSFDRAGLPLPEGSPKVGVLEQILETVDDGCGLVFTGDGADLHSDAILQFHHLKCESEAKPQESRGGWSILSGTGFLAERIARLAYEKFKNGEAVNPRELEACYVRSADVKIQKQV